MTNANYANHNGRAEHDRTAGWDARWIAKAQPDHRAWSRIALETDVAIEAGEAHVLFGVRDDRRYWGCELRAAEGEAAFYSVEDGARTERGRAAAPELAAAPARAAARIAHEGDALRLYVNGRLALTATAPASEVPPGTIGFRTGERGRAVFRELRVFAEDGRALYVNRFYDPSCLQFTAGAVDATGSGLRLEEGILALCEAPVSADSPLFRRAFVAPSDVVRATVRVYAAGWYELRVNGRKLDDRVLAPANTPYGRRMLYDEYDATSALRQGGNAIGLWLGNGYNMNYSRWGWKWKREKAALLQLDMTLADGSALRIGTDETWLTADSPLLMNDIYDGETFDGRRASALEGWDTYAYEPAAADWSPAILAPAPEGVPERNEQPPVRAFEPLAPTRVLRPRPGVAVYDFGQNIAGWARVRVEGAAGNRLTLRYSELIDAEGNIDPWTNRNARATDVYILHGQGIETYEPRFTYHGFRYVEASGDPIEAQTLRIEAVPIRADVTIDGSFRCADPLVERIQSNLRWSILNNLVTIPTDCCQRDERTPCMMDSAVVEETAMLNFGMRDYYRKWLGDVEDSLSNPDWSGDKVTLPWHLYRHYGDADTLGKQYASMKSYIDHLAAKWPDGIVTEGFGDWCPPNDDGWENYFREVAIVNTALYYRQTAVVAEAAGALGRAEEQARYEAHANEIRRASHDRFYRGNGVYGDGTQTAQLLPLAYGLAFEEAAGEAFDRLIDAIAAKGNRLDTGIYGTRYLMDVLADGGRIDLAYELLTRTDYPSFGYQIEQGATTLWEQWSFKGGMHSHDHAMFAGIGASFYTRLAGIRPLEPGYAKVEIAPSVPAKLDWVEAAIDTVRGRLVSAWRKESGRVTLEIEIPQGATAVVRLPRPVDGAEPKRIEVGPGKHRFTN
ncbi:family 78 glycoside hydrolase catalytic domain [Paenibacillus sp.]|uniref:family 78 glycoside hydrolase catalytic domain n=1 Tax=Paenibacillus sp. TaxID=58172 RepID=UPI002D320274|nr:family 78 glycoside hydrolase catalytic domain [Paenibacillus sp.]HZG56733.1 family 78 glycoside hydrolase catalytic domain [Paenibacillus sp.]